MPSLFQTATGTSKVSAAKKTAPAKKAVAKKPAPAKSAAKAAPAKRKVCPFVSTQLLFLTTMAVPRKEVVEYSGFL